MEKISGEMLEIIASGRCSNTSDCSTCVGGRVCKSTLDDLKTVLAKTLLEERKQPKVWDGAPEWANCAVIQWQNNEKALIEYRPSPYTRDLPKSPIREIAKKEAHKYNNYYGGFFYDKEKRLTDAIESAITEAIALKA